MKKIKENDNDKKVKNYCPCKNSKGWGILLGLK